MASHHHVCRGLPGAGAWSSLDRAARCIANRIRSLRRCCKIALWSTSIVGSRSAGSGRRPGWASSNARPSITGPSALPSHRPSGSRSSATLITGLRLFFEVLEGETATAVERSEEIVLTLSKAKVARLQELRAEIPSVLFSSPVMGPAFDVEADFALCQLAILQGTELDRRQASHPPDRPVAN